MGNNSLTVHFCDNRSILVVNAIGKLKQVHVPFRVFSTDNATAKRQVYIVEEVLPTDRDGLLYVINGKPYHHYHFFIDMQF